MSAFIVALFKRLLMLKLHSAKIKVHNT